MKSAKTEVCGCAGRQVLVEKTNTERGGSVKHLESE